MVTWFRKVGGLVLGVAVCALATLSPAAQDQPAVLLVLDRSAIDYGPPPHLIPSDAANDQIASVGLRDPIPYFTARVGASVVLPSGGDGNDGWFALRSPPASWSDGSGSDDGLENFWLAGPGLGSPDDDGDRTALLMSVEDVVPVRGPALGALVGRRVCAVAYSGQIAAVSGPPSMAGLSGATLGVVAFQVVSVDGSGTDWPDVTVQVLDLRDACAGVLTAFAEAGS